MPRRGGEGYRTGCILMHCWLFCSFDAVNSTEVEPLQATEHFIVLAREKSLAVPVHRRGSFAVAHSLGVSMFGLCVHPIWMKRAEAAGLHVCLRFAANTASGGHFLLLLISFFLTSEKKHWIYFSQAFFFSLFVSVAMFKCTVQIFLCSYSFCTLFRGKGVKMSCSLNEKLSAVWTVYWSHWGDLLDSICRSFLTGSQDYSIYETRAHCLLLINRIRSRVRHRQRSQTEETGRRRVVWWKQISLGARERD